MVEPQSGKVALITGATGQDGAYLSELLLSKGYVRIPAMPPGRSGMMPLTIP